jgi:ribonuclease HII
MRVLGIDEAGRGCVLGPLVVAGFLVEESSIPELVTAGARDSKKLSAKRRDSARLALDTLGIADVRMITPAEIDAGNLNQLEESMIMQLIVAHRPDRVLIDALGHPKTLPALCERLLTELARHDLTPELLMEPKADDRYPSVGAASIFAKTSRDAEIAALKEAWGDFGSGYPSDPKTRRWLEAHAATREPWPSFVRTRWGTVRALAQLPLS